MIYGIGTVRSVTCLFLILVVALSKSQAEDFYCQKDQAVHIENISEGRIITREEDDAHYSNSLHCTWIIRADEDQAIHITVLESHLQWAPVGAICVGYDYVIMYNGISSDVEQLLTWCGEKNPRSITTIGPDVRIEFYSNDRNQYVRRGVRLEFEVFERTLSDGGCPPGWVDDTDLPGGGESCYMLKTHPETWTMSQAFCGYDQANLVTMNTRKEEQFLVEMVSNSLSVSQEDHVWISLNDIKVDGQYHWLDGSPVTFVNWKEPDQSAESYYNCIQMNKDGFWQEDFCNENNIQSVVKHKFICEKQKVGKTEIFTIPSERINKGGEKTVTPQKTWIILAILSACVVVAVIIIASLVWYCQKRKKSPTHLNNRSARKRSAGGEEVLEPIAQGQSPRSQVCNERPAPTAPPALSAEQQTEPNTIVVIMQQPNHPNEPPPSYAESEAHRPTVM